MRTAEELSPEQLLAIAGEIQMLLYADWDEAGNPIWNPAKTWDGADVCQEMAWVLNHVDAAPSTTSPRTIISPTNPEV